MGNSSDLPGVPLAAARDQARFGEEIALLSRLAGEGASGVPAGLALDGEAVAGLRATEPDASGRESWERGWEWLGRPRAVGVRAVEIGGEGGAGRKPTRPLAVRDGGSLLDVLRDASRDVLGEAARSEARGEQGTALLVLAWVAPGTPGEAAGVAYSEDPREDRVEEVHLDVWPLDALGARVGEAVRYRRPRIGGRWSTEIPAGAQTVLPSGALEAVVARLRGAEALLGESLALEWRWRAGAVVDGGLEVGGVSPQRTPLPWAMYRAGWGWQSHDDWRPATAGEATPVTPLSWSMMGEPLNAGLAATYPSKGPLGRRHLALFGGYAYVNLGVAPRRGVERMGGAAAVAPGGPGDPPALGGTGQGARRPMTLPALPAIMRSTRRQRRLPGRWAAGQEALAALRAEIVGVNPAGVDSATIVAAVEHIYAAQSSHVQFFVEAREAALRSVALLGELTQWFLGDASLGERLVRGLGEEMTTEWEARLWRLAERAAAEPETRLVVLGSAPAALAAALRESSTGGWLAAELEALTAEPWRGGAAALELMAPRRAVEATAALRRLQSYVADPEGTRVEARVERQRGARTAALREVESRLTSRWWERALPLRRAVVQHYTSRARRYAPLREEPRSAVLAVGHEARRLLLVLGGRLASQGALGETEDVFFLERGELGTLVEAARQGRDGEEEGTMGRLRRRAWRRRRFYAEALERGPAAIVGPSAE